MYIVYHHGRWVRCSYLVQLYLLHEQCLKIYCWKGGGGAPSDRKQTKSALGSHQFTNPLITGSFRTLIGV